MSTPERYFEAIYRQDDPFGYRDRWYEERKRALLLASLPRPRFASGWELGCSNGELTAALAARCDTLLATDLSARAVELARARTAGLPGVRVVQAAHPRDWPPGRFQLIVFSELGYYLDEPTLTRCTARLRASLARGGVLVACHWRHPFRQACMDGDAVHRRLDAMLGWPRLFAHVDQDFRLEGWDTGGGSVAAREGLR